MSDRLVIRTKVAHLLFPVLLFVAHLFSAISVMAAEEPLASSAAAVLNALETLDDLGILSAGDRLMTDTAAAKDVPREVPIALSVYADRCYAFGETATAERAMKRAAALSKPSEGIVVRALRSANRAESLLLTFHNSILDDDGQLKRGGEFRKLLGAARRQVAEALKDIPKARAGSSPADPFAPLFERTRAIDPILKAFGVPARQAIINLGKALDRLPPGKVGSLARLRINEYAAFIEEQAGLKDKAFARLQAEIGGLGPLEYTMEGISLIHAHESVPLGRDQDEIVRSIIERLDRIYDRFGERDGVTGWKFESSEDLMLIGDYAAGYRRLLSVARSWALRDGPRTSDWASLVAGRDDLYGPHAPPTVRAAFLAALTGNPAILDPSNEVYPQLRSRLFASLAKSGLSRDADQVLTETVAAPSPSDQIRQLVDVKAGSSVADIEYALASLGRDDENALDRIRLEKARFEAVFRDPQRYLDELTRATLLYAQNFIDLGLYEKAATEVHRMENALLSAPNRDRKKTSIVLGLFAKWYAEHHYYERARLASGAAVREEIAVEMAAVMAGIAAETLSLPLSLDIGSRVAYASRRAYEAGFRPQSDDVFVKTLHALIERAESGRDVENTTSMFSNLLFFYGRVKREQGDLALAMRLERISSLAMGARREILPDLLRLTGVEQPRDVPYPDTRSSQPAATLEQEKVRLGLNTLPIAQNGDSIALLNEGLAAEKEIRLDNARATLFLAYAAAQSSNTEEGLRTQEQAGRALLRLYAPFVPNIALGIAAETLQRSLAAGTTDIRILAELTSSQYLLLTEFERRVEATELIRRVSREIGQRSEVDYLAFAIELVGRVPRNRSILAALVQPDADRTVALFTKAANDAKDELSAAANSGVAVLLAAFEGVDADEAAFRDAKISLERLANVAANRFPRSRIAGWAASVILSQCDRWGIQTDRPLLRRYAEAAEFPSITIVAAENSPAALFAQTGVPTQRKADARDYLLSPPLSTVGAESRRVTDTLKNGLSIATNALTEERYLDGAREAIRAYEVARGGSKDELTTAFADYVSRFEAYFGAFGAHLSPCDQEWPGSISTTYVAAECARAALAILNLRLKRQIEYMAGEAGKTAGGERVTTFGATETLINFLSHYAAVPGGVTEDLFQTSLQYMALEAIDPTSVAIRWSALVHSAVTADPARTAKLVNYQTALRNWLAGPLSGHEQEFLFAADEVGSTEINKAQQKLLAQLTLPNMRAALGTHEALVAFRAAGDQVVAWILTTQEFAVVPLSISTSDILAITNQLRAAIDPQKSGGEPYPIGKAYDLYAGLFGSLERYLSTIDTLVISPDPAFANLPLAALVTTAPKMQTWTVANDWNPRWLGEQFAVTLLPAVDALGALRRLTNTKATSEVALFGDPEVIGGGLAPNAAVFEEGRARPEALRRKFSPLPGAAAEIDAIHKAIPMAREFSGSEYRKAAVTNLKTPLKAVLFATHAEPAIDTNPAYLLATPPQSASSDDDGAITGDDIVRAQLSAQVVVLSACQTGAGIDRLGGYGQLTSAFFTNGTVAVVATHVTIPDEALGITAGLMTHAARDGANGLAKELQERIVSLIGNRQDDPRMRHPTYWAAFFIIGAP